MRGLAGAVLFVLGVAAVATGTVDGVVCGAPLATFGVWLMVSGIGS